MTSEEEIRQHDLKLLKEACRTLMMHFDTVQILATRHDPTHGTMHACWGEGNWFSRYGQVSRWLDNENAVDRLEHVGRSGEKEEES